MAILLPKKTAHRKVRKGKNNGIAIRCNRKFIRKSKIEQAQALLEALRRDRLALASR